MRLTAAVHDHVAVVLLVPEEKGKGKASFLFVACDYAGLSLCRSADLDVLRVLDWLNAWGYGHVHLAAKGYSALPSTFAALLSPHVIQVTLKNALTSYSELAEAKDYRWPLSPLLPGVLTSFDLPDCYRELKKKNLKLLEPWGATSGD